MDEVPNIKSAQDDIVEMKNFNCLESVQELQDNDIKFLYAPNELWRLAQDDGKESLYLGYTKYTTLSIIAKLYHIKSKHGWSNKSFGDLLELLRDMLPISNTILESSYA